MNLNVGIIHRSMIRMGISNPHEEIANIQHELLTNLKKSHHLFTQKFHFETVAMLLAIFVFTGFEVAFYFFIPSSFNSTLLGPSIFFVFFTIQTGIRIKKGRSFLQWSTFQLREIEISAAPSQVLNGLPLYISKLFAAAYAGTHHMDPVDKTPERILKEIQHQDHKGTVVFIVAMCVFFPLITWLAWAIWSAPIVNFPIAFSVIFLYGLIGIFIGIFSLDKRWGRSVRKWTGYYEALDLWGIDLISISSENFKRYNEREEGN